MQVFDTAEVISLIDHLSAAPRQLADHVDNRGTVFYKYVEKTKLRLSPSSTISRFSSSGRSVIQRHQKLNAFGRLLTLVTSDNAAITCRPDNFDGLSLARLVKDCGRLYRMGGCAVNLAAAAILEQHLNIARYGILVIKSHTEEGCWHEYIEGTASKGTLVCLLLSDETVPSGTMREGFLRPLRQNLN